MLIDTSILIAEWRRDRRAVALVRAISRGRVCYVASITRFEMFAGAGPKQIVDTTAFLDRFMTLDLDASTADLAGQLGWAHRATHGKKAADLLVAATAIGHRLQLVTYNQNDFPMPRIKLYPVSR